MEPSASRSARVHAPAPRGGTGALRHSLFLRVMGCYRTLFARKRFYGLNKLLFNLSLRGIGLLNDQPNGFESTGEGSFLRRISASWGPEPLVLDVGAGAGEYSNRIMELRPGACVFAFEAHPQTFTTLRAHAVRYGYAAFNLACGHERASLTLYDREGSGGSAQASLYREVIESLHRQPAVAQEVNVIALDDFVTEHGLERIDLVKIDTEGHELRVLEGLRRTIARNAIDVVQFEFNAMNVISRCFFRDFVEILPRYRFHRMVLDGLVPLGEYSPTLCELFAFQNVVALREGCGLRL